MHFFLPYQAVLQDGDLVPLPSRRQLQIVVKKIRESQTRELKLSEDESMQLSLPAVVLQDRCNQSPAFRRLFQEHIQSRPLILIFGYDEAVPGNVLLPDNRRKCTLVYVSFLEFGSLLYKQGSWMTAGLVRTDVVNNVQGGMTCVMASFFKAYLAHWTDAGFVVTIVGRSILVRARTQFLYADIAGHKLTFSCKGSSGLKPCRKCSNVVSKAAGRDLGLHMAQFERFVDISEHDPEKFLPLSDEEAYAVVDNLKDLRVQLRSAAAFEKEETLFGWNFEPEGLMMCPNLRNTVKPSMACVDSMHTYDGIASLEIGLFLAACKQKVPNWDVSDFRTFARDWKSNLFLEGTPSNVQELALSMKLLTKNPYPGSATQTKIVLQLLDAFSQSVLHDVPEITAERASLESLAVAMREVDALKFRYKDLASSNLRQLQSTYLQRFVQAYGRGMVLPKHHEQFHLLPQWQDQELVVDCWVLERKHQLFLELAPSMKQLQNFEANVLPHLLLKESKLASKLCSEMQFDGPGKVLQLDREAAAEFGFRSACQLHVGRALRLPTGAVLRLNSFFKLKGTAQLFSVESIFAHGRDFFCLCNVYDNATPMKLRTLSCCVFVSWGACRVAVIAVVES